MTSSITEDEITQAFRSQIDNHALGADHVPDEVLMYSTPVVADFLTKSLNRHIQNLTPSMRGRIKHGVIITVPKPNKPTGTSANLRPINLLSTTCKNMSTVILNRIRKKLLSGSHLTRAAFESPAAQLMQYGHTDRI